tara:strand:+ start:269 stop:490 length:222 start_codon:yes stop_codon:yes gene_type:complete
MIRKYKVTYKIDYLDNKPSVDYFDCFYEMQEFVSSEKARRIQFTVDHSPNLLTENDLRDLNAIENDLITIEEI